jgi:hypothetical protein
LYLNKIVSTVITEIATATKEASPMNFSDDCVRGYRRTPFQLSLVYANQPKMLVFVKVNAIGICMKKMAG